MITTWKKINGYRNYYVSYNGQVKTTDYNHTGKEKIISVFKNVYGYMAVNLMEDGKRKRHLVHRLVCEAFCDKKEKSYNQVNHIDCNKTNNDYRNLEWCNSKININHAVENKLFNPSKGENHYASKLTDEEVLEIKKLRKIGGLRLQSIAKLYGTTDKNISSITLNKTRNAFN